MPGSPNLGQYMSKLGFQLKKSVQGVIYNKNSFLIEYVGFPMNLTAKTASPVPGVSVPTHGSWKFLELS